MQPNREKKGQFLCQTSKGSPNLICQSVTSGKKKPDCKKYCCNSNSVVLHVGPNSDDDFSTISDALDASENKDNVVLILSPENTYELDSRTETSCSRQQNVTIIGDDRPLVGVGFFQVNPGAIQFRSAEAVSVSPNEFIPPEYGQGSPQIRILDSATIEVTQIPSSSEPSQTVIQPDFTSFNVGDEVTWVDKNGILSTLHVAGIPTSNRIEFTEPIPGAIAGTAPYGTGFVLTPNVKIVAGTLTEAVSPPFSILGLQALSFTSFRITFVGLHFLITDTNVPDNFFASPPIVFVVRGDFLVSGKCVWGSPNCFFTFALISRYNSCHPNAAVNSRWRVSGINGEARTNCMSFMGKEANISGETNGRVHVAYSIFSGCDRAFYLGMSTSGFPNTSSFYNCERSVEVQSVAVDVGSILIQNDQTSTRFRNPNTIGIYLKDNACANDTISPSIENLRKPTAIPKSSGRLLAIIGCGTALKLERGSSFPFYAYTMPFGPVNGPNPFVANVFAATIEGVTFTEAAFAASPQLVQVLATPAENSYVFKGPPP